MALLSPYRALGLVTDGNPFHHKQLGNQHFISLSIGKAWQVYNLEKLRLVMIGPERPNKIRAIASIKDFTYTTDDSEIIVWRRTNEVARLVGHTSPVVLLYLFGNRLISIEENQTVHVWDTDIIRSVCRESKEEQNQADVLLKSTGQRPDVAVPRLDPPLAFTLADSSPRSSARSPACILHPHTYLNKVVIGFDDGDLELWNIKTCKKIYSFKSSVWLRFFASNSESGLASLLSNPDDDDVSDQKRIPNVRITCIQQSTVVDVAALGFENGWILIVNLRKDKILAKFQLSATHGVQSVTGISFRSDGHDIMTTASNTGQIHVWDLKKGALKNIIHDAHTGAISTCFFVPGQPLLVTSGRRDNALKMWIFDRSDGSGRLLRYRAGHNGASSRIRYYDQKGFNILSAGLDQALRSFSTIRDQQSTELSQGSLISKAKAYGTSMQSLRLSQIVDFDASPVKEREWANIITAHRNDVAAYIWRYSHKALDKLKLISPNAKHSSFPVTGVCLSACGSIGVVGRSNGTIEQYSMQSGYYRGFYQPPNKQNTPYQNDRKESKTVNKTDSQNRKASSLAEIMNLHSPNPDNKKRKIQHNPENPTERRKKRRKKKKKEAHDATITGLAIDGLNRRLVSTSLDGTIKFWNLATMQLEHSVTIPGSTAISSMRFCRISDLVAVTTDDLTTYIYDSNSFKLVRRFSGHSHQITDMTFSGDGRLLLTASMDSTVRIYDLPTGRLIDWIGFVSPVTSLDFSSKGDFLSTTHVDTTGIFTWINRSYFTHVELSSVPNEPTYVNLPRSNTKHMADEDDVEDGDEDVDEDEDEDEDQDEDEDEDEGDAMEIEKSKSDGKGGLLVTLSELPSSHWETLPNIEHIKQRNKPKEAPKAPTKAPFFLSTLAGINPSLNPQADKKNEKKEESHLSQGFVLEDTELIKRLVSISQQPGGVLASQNIAPVTSYLKSLSPSQLDAEVRSIAIDLEHEERDLLLLLEYLCACLTGKNDFEFLQAMTNLILKVHGDTMVTYPSAHSLLSTLKRRQCRIWRKLDNEFQASLCLVTSFSNLRGI